MLSGSITLEGEIAHANIPTIAIPENRIDAAPGIIPRESGSFGPCTAANHNAYECYASPLIFARLVTATIDQNRARNFEAREPLPPDLTPVGGVPNQNLIDYRDVEILNAEGQKKLRGIAFPNVNDMASRLKWCPALNGLVFGTLKNMESKFSMDYGPPKHGTNTAALGWTYVESIDDALNSWNTVRLIEQPSVVKSPSAFGNTQANSAHFHGFRRERLEHARGFCYTIKI